MAEEEITYEELVQHIEEQKLVEKEIYTFDIDDYRVIESQAGDIYLMLNLVVNDGSKEGVEVETFGPMFPSTFSKWKIYQRSLEAFQLDIHQAAEIGCKSNSRESAEAMGNYLKDSVGSVEGKALKPRANQQDVNNVLLVPSK